MGRSPARPSLDEHEACLSGELVIRIDWKKVRYELEADDQYAARPQMACHVRHGHAFAA